MNNMKLRDIVEKLADLVEIEVIIDECGNVAGKYTDRDHINDYLDCEVEIIDTSEDGVLIVTVIDDPEE